MTDHDTNRPSPRGNPSRLSWGIGGLVGCLVALAFLGPLSGTSRADWKDLLNFRSDESDQNAESADKRIVREGTTLDTRYVGDYVTAFGGTTMIEVRGVGLVNGLDGTGEDPPPSAYRTALIEEMRRQKIENPNRILAMPSTAMVIVKAYIPINSRKGDTFDVEVMLPPNSEATSLAGGVLFATRLTEEKSLQGRTLHGDVLAIAQGPILVSAISGGSTIDLGAMRRGKVLGGGESKIDRDLAMALRNEYRSGRNSRRVADAIGIRFHGHDRSGIKIPMAEAKTDQQILLRVPKEYYLNIPRYINVIREIALNETAITRRVRMQKLEQQIAIPAQSEQAALRLEAIGADALPSLKRALVNKNQEVRFNAAMSLTYMGKTDGLAELGRAAQAVPAFRIYAFAALASCREAEAAVVLSKLLNDPVDEIRYGAFRALTEMNAQDPLVRGIPIEGNYKFHVLDTEDPPLVHVTNHSRAEVVLFGENQELLLPATLRAGQHIQIVANSGSGTVTISRFSGRKTGSKEVQPRLRDIIMACDEFGATYPDIVSLLAQASRQHNLQGQLAVDALPVAGREFIPEDESGTKRRIGSEYTAPNLYAPSADDAIRAREEDIVNIPDTNDTTSEKAISEDAGVIQTASFEEPGEMNASPGDAQDDAPPQSEASDSSSEAMELPSDQPPLQGEMPEDAPRQEAPPQVTPSQGKSSAWYNPRGWFRRPNWIPSGGPPPQSEPGIP